MNAAPDRLNGSAGAAQSAARAAWGDALPDWIAELAMQLDRSGNIRGARKRLSVELGYSPSFIDQVSKRRCAAPTDGLEAAVRALFMTPVACPVLGEIARHHCRQMQRLEIGSQKYRAARLWHTCPTCPNRGAAAPPRE